MKIAIFSVISAVLAWKVPQISQTDSRAVAVIKAINSARANAVFTSGGAKPPALKWNQNLANCAYYSMNKGTPKFGITYYDSFGKVWCYRQTESFGTVTRWQSFTGGKEPSALNMTNMINGMLKERKGCVNPKGCCNGRRSDYGGEVEHYTQIMWAGTIQVGCGFGSKGLQCWFAKQGNMAGLDLCSSSTSTVGKVWTY